MTLLHNPGAGKGEWTRKDLTAAFETAGVAIDYWSFDDDPLSHQQRFALGAPIVIAGGDGAVAGVLKGLDDATRAIAVLPTGGSNNLARSLGVFGDVREIIAELGSAPTQDFGLLKADGSCCQTRIVEALGVGALNEAMVVDDKTRSTTEKREHGRKLAREAIRAAAPMTTRIRIDDRPIDDDVLFVEALNVPMIGPHLLLADAPHDAGPAFDVAWLPAGAADAFIRWLDGPAGERPAPLRRVKAERLTIAGATNLRIDDGFIEHDGGKITVAGDPRVFKLITPMIGRRDD